MTNLNSCKGAKGFMFFSRGGVKCNINVKTRSGRESCKFSRSAGRKNNIVLFLSGTAANYIPVFVISILVILAAFFMKTAFKGRTCKAQLKYGWDTYIDTVRGGEYVLREQKNSGSCQTYALICRDIFHTVDGLEDFRIKNGEVTYVFDQNRRLIQIYYDFREMNNAGLCAAAAQYFGKGLLPGESNAEACRDIIIDTENAVIVLCSNSISYFKPGYYRKYSYSG